MIGKLLLVFVVLVILYGVYGPTPDGREPYPSDISDPLDINTLKISFDRLVDAEYITGQNFLGPEDVALDRQGNIYTGLHDGSIVKITPSRKKQTIGKAKGSILGLSNYINSNEILFVDAVAGVSKINIETREITVLVSLDKYPAIISPNSVTYGPDGIIYFTNTGNIKMDAFQKQILSGHPDGQIYSYDPSTNKLQLLVKNVFFPNGIVHNKKKSPDEEIVYFAETIRFRVSRLYVKGEKKGKVQIITDNILGYVDNLKLNEKGEIWVATPGIRDNVSNLVDRSTIIRRILLNVRLPLGLFLFLANKTKAGGIKIDPVTGEIVEYFFGKPDRIDFVTGITEHEGKLYLSSIKNRCIAVVDYP